MRWIDENKALHFINLSFSLVRILAEDLASKNRPPTSLMSSFVMDERPFTFAVRAAGVSNCTAYLS